VTWRRASGAALAVLTFECLLRCLQAGSQSIDPRLGWVWRSVTVRHRLAEGWGVSHWRDDETRARPAPAANAPRVLVVGDSFTEALQVDDDEVFTGRLRRVDAINVGRSSHSAADYAAFAGEYLSRFHPSWTVVEVGPPDFAEDAFNASKTHFDSHLNVVIVPPRFGRVSGALKVWRDRSALLDNAIARWQLYRAAAKMPPLFRAADAETSSAAPRRQPDETWPVADEMRLIRRAYGERVTFLFIPPLEAPSAVESQFLAACAADRSSCVDFRTTFAAFRARGAAPFGFPNSRFGVGHLNAGGHAAVAQILEIELERLRARGLF
jgi:hypothetical protein